MRYLRLANEDQTTVIDLLRDPTIHLSGGVDFSTPNQGGVFTYEPYGAQWAFGNFQPQVETFDLTLKGSPAAVIAASNRIQDFLEAVRLFHNSDLAAKSCWLEWSADGENVKRSLLYNGVWAAVSQDNVTPGLEECTLVGTLQLGRHPLWETKTESAFTELSISTLGGTINTPDVPGNTLARIAQLRIGTTVAAANLYRFWIGNRRFNQGIANFEPVWECEYGTPGTDCSAAPGVLDATASPEHIAPGTGARHRITFATLTLASRLTITVDQVCAAAGHTDYNDQQGRYLVLLRCKVTAAGTCGVQMHYGYTGNQVAEEIYVDNTNWRLIPLGNISIPPWEGDDYSTNAVARYFRIDLYAEQLTAGVNLDLDCLVLIPNEHIIFTEGSTVSAGANEILARTNEDDTEVVYQFSGITSYINDAIDASPETWYVPPGLGVVVCAGERQTQHLLTDTMQATFNYVPRWTLYRRV